MKALTEILLASLKEITDLKEVKLFLNSKQSTINVKAYPAVLLGYTGTKYTEKSQKAYVCEHEYQAVLFTVNKGTNTDKLELMHQELLEKICDKLILTKYEVEVRASGVYDRTADLVISTIDFVWKTSRTVRKD